MAITTRVVGGPGDARSAEARVGDLLHEPPARRMIELRFFSSRPFAAATVIAIAALAAFGGCLFVNTLYLQEVRGLSPAIAGLCMLPIGATIMLCSAISGRVVGARGIRWPLVLGGLGLGAVA